MADIVAKVGEKSPNNFYDVALIQAMLQVIRNPKNQPYLSAHYDGVCGSGTINAIKAFQTDNGTATMPVSAPPRSAGFGLPPLKPSLPGVMTPNPGMTPAPSGQRFGFGLPTLSLLDDLGVIKPGGPTLDKLNELLPPQFKQIRSAPGLHFVYWSGSAGDASDSAATISSNTELHEVFRKNVADLVKQMFDKYEIVLTLTPSGGRRTFQKQYELKTGPGDVTNAGPGESNHNFGQAVDIGFNGFKWMTPIGMIVTDDWWLNKMVKTHSHWVPEMWRLRDAIGFDQLGMFKSNKDGDDIHIQRYSDDNVSVRKSLAKLLDTAGTMNWRLQHDYECNLGFTGGAFHPVGKATQIWDKSGPMQKAWIAAGKHIAVTAVTDADVTAMRNALRADFEAAEAARDRWTAEPK
jgi:hypothetical protein